MTKFAILFMCVCFIFAAHEDWIDMTSNLSEYANEPHFVEGMPDECMTEEECEQMRNEELVIYEDCNEAC